MNNVIYIFGYYGRGNIGDDLFAYLPTKTLVDFYKTKPKIIILLPKNIYFIESKYIVVIQNKFLRKIYSFYLYLSSKYVIYFGGSIFKKKFSLIDPRRYLFIRKLLGLSTFAFSVSIGPFISLNDERYFLNYLKKMNRVVIRDNLTYGLDNVVSSFDIVLLISEHVFVKKTQNNEPILGLSLHNSFFSVGNSGISFNTTFLNLANTLINKYRFSKIQMFLMNENHKSNELILSKYASEFFNLKKIKTEIVIYSDDLNDFLSKLSSSTVFVGARLHSAILCFALGVPFVNFEYADKCTKFLDLINYPLRINKYLDDIDINQLDYLIKYRKEFFSKNEVYKQDIKNSIKFIN